MKPPPHDECFVSGRYYACPCTDCEEYIRPGPNRPQLCARAITKYAAENGGLSAKQISKILGVNYHTLYGRLNVCLEKLRFAVKK